MPCMSKATRVGFCLPYTVKNGYRIVSNIGLMDYSFIPTHYSILLFSDFVPIILFASPIILSVLPVILNYALSKNC